MNSLIFTFISVFVAVIYCEAGPHTPKLQKVPLGVVNGTKAEDGKFPYMVQLFENGFFTCGGAIIGEKWILTAGHCSGENLDTVVYGTNKLDERSHKNKQVKVKTRYQHPKFYYNYTNAGDVPLYDVGILELETPIPFDNKTKPLKLAGSDDVPFHVPGMLAGWGFNSTYSGAMKDLQKIELQLLNSLECARAIANYIGHDVFNGTHDLCSDDHFNGECFGDSGSPFVINGLGYGIVSWSFKPCGSNPGTYSRITNPEYRSFIREVTGI